MNVQYQNTVSVDDYLRLRQAVGWKPVSRRQAQAALDHSSHLVSGSVGGKTISSARLVSDGGTVFFIADVMVNPEYQGLGVGKAMVALLLERARAMLADGEQAKVVLMAAVGREPFYEKQGFSRHPSDQFGAGMSYLIEK